MSDTDRKFTCPDCGKSSTHPKDIEFGYCGNCHSPTGARRPRTPENTPCPAEGCGGVGLVVEEVFVPQGTPHSLAGVQLKVAGRFVLRWRCPACGASGPAS